MSSYRLPMPVDVALTDLISAATELVQRLERARTLLHAQAAPAPQPSPARPYLSRAEAAEYLGLVPNTLDAWRAKNEGPRAIKAGRRVLYAISDLDAYMSANATGPTSER